MWRLPRLAAWAADGASRAGADWLGRAASPARAVNFLPAAPAHSGMRGRGQGGSLGPPLYKNGCWASRSQAWCATCHFYRPLRCSHCSAPAQLRGGVTPTPAPGPARPRTPPPGPAPPLASPMTPALPWPQPAPPLALAPPLHCLQFRLPRPPCADAVPTQDFGPPLPLGQQLHRPLSNYRYFFLFLQ